jgi:hypothetical protein
MRLDGLFDASALQRSVIITYSMLGLNPDGGDTTSGVNE